MTKFTIDEKLNAVKRYLEGNEGHRVIADDLGVNYSLFRTWIKQYNFNGENAFEKKYTAYTLQFKLDVLNYMNEQGTSIKETAAFFNIPSPSTLLKWKKQFGTGGMDALELMKKGRPSMKKNNSNSKKNQEITEGSIEALRAENEQLRMENAYLKKLNALVQNKVKLPNKTRLK